MIKFIFLFLNKEQEFHSASMTKVYDFVNTLIEHLPTGITWQPSNFSILCEQYPQKYGKYGKSYKTKVLYVCFMNDNGTTHRFYPPDFEEYNIKYVIITENQFRKVGERRTPFWLNGHTVKQVFQDYPYYNYSIGNLIGGAKSLIAKLRERYNIPEPVPFVGKQQELVIEDDNENNEIPPDAL